MIGECQRCSFQVLGVKLNAGEVSLVVRGCLTGQQVAHNKIGCPDFDEHPDHGEGITGVEI